MSSNRVARRAMVHGRVQGVWYRAGTAQKALALGLTGHARNLGDGSVEVVAIGSAQAVDTLFEWLWQGPPLARVTRVVVEDLDAAAAAAGAVGFVTK